MFDWAWCVLHRACELLNHVSFMSLAWFGKRWNEYWFLVLNFFNHSWLSFPLFETSCDILGQSYKKGTICQLGRVYNFWSLMDSIVSNNPILYIWKLLTWELILCFLTTHTHTHIHTRVVTYPAYFLLPVKMNESAPSPVCYGQHNHVCMLITQLCLTLGDSVDCSLQGSSVHGILQARILEWGTIPFSRESSQPKDWTHISYIFCTGKWVLYHWRHLESPLY